MKSRLGMTVWLTFAVVGAVRMAEARRLNVTDARSLVAAIAKAAPGDEILLAPGIYRLGRLSCEAAGTADKPITIRSEPPLAAKIEFDAVEGFVVSGPQWHFEDLDIKGVCASHSACEHAFHVIGGGDYFVMKRNRIFDFNAHLKVNATPGEGGLRDIPNDGLVEANELGNSSIRNTDNPVTPIDIDNGSRWVVRQNYVHDFHKGLGNRTSYGAFVKGGGSDPVFERNLILCQRDVRPEPDASTIGLSFGGGGMAPALCAPAFNARVPCDSEVKGGIMRNNIIASCTDVGIYLNNAAGARLFNNTLIATSGIDVRFPGSKAEIHGNVLSGPIRMRNGAVYTGSDNLTNVNGQEFQGWYADPLKGDLRKKGDLTSLIDKAPSSPFVTDDYCGRPRNGSKPELGALEHSLGDCRTTRP